MVWTFYDFCGIGAFKQEELGSKLKSILDISGEELNYYLNQLKHGSDSLVGLEKLWVETVKVIHTMPDTKENYFVFLSEFSKICKGAFRNLEIS